MDLTLKNKKHDPKEIIELLLRSHQIIDDGTLYLDKYAESSYNPRFCFWIETKKRTHLGVEIMFVYEDEIYAGRITQNRAEVAQFSFTIIDSYPKMDNPFTV